NSLPGLFYVFDEERFIRWNKKWEKVTGYSEEELATKYGPDFFKGKDRTLIAEQMLKGFHEGVAEAEVELVTKDGQRIPYYFTGLRKKLNGKDYLVGLGIDITRRKRMEGALQRRNRELTLLNQASQTLTSTLDMDQILVTILEEVRRMMTVDACSIWLIDAETGELVCRQATGHQNEMVRGWRLAPGVGIAGSVVRSGESLIVPDAWADERYFKGVEEQIELALRAILTVPLRVKNGIMGVLQLVDGEIDRFSTSDQTLLELLAATAAIAIENAQLYKQAQQEAETKAVLLREVNHRVKNNLTGIMGLLHSARRRVIVKDQATYRSTMDDLISRVRGLSTVHSMLSASGWAPLRLSHLATEIINSAVQTLPRDNRMSLDVLPSPVRVTSSQAHNLALVLNELATNAVKYAQDEGKHDAARITLRITLDDDTVQAAPMVSASPMVRLEFRDDGPGYPQDVLQLERHNVGFDLIKNITRRGLRGELELYNDHGAVAVIRFPVNR
ncbi:MAG: GAF domain-containing protein, partial [Chloroflexi bacterium]|nr:GAF domain-containing protein [Chloroflexota bacterium]